MRVYIAGAFEDKERLADIREEIEDRGHDVTSTWLDEENDPYPGLERKFATEAVTPEQAFSYAVRDLGEIRVSDMLLIDTAGTNVRAGREVEYGYALAHGIQVRIVGPRRNVFHQLAEQFATWDDALASLAKWQA